MSVRVILNPATPTASMLGRMTVEQITPCVEEAYLAPSLNNEGDAKVMLTYQQPEQKLVVHIIPGSKLNPKTVFLIEKYLSSSGLPILSTYD